MKKLLYPFLFLLLILTLSGQAQTEEKVLNDSCIQTNKSVGLNGAQKLELFASCEINDFHFKLYNRWGTLVYETDKFLTPIDLDITQKIKKDGVEKPKYPNGLYLWVANYTRPSYNGPVKRQSTGSISIFSEP